MAGYGGGRGTSTSGIEISALNERLSKPTTSGKQILNVTQRVSTAQIELFTASTTKAKGQLAVAKTLSVQNRGRATLGVHLKFNNWSAEATIGTGGTGDANPSATFVHMIVPVGQTLSFPTARALSSTTGTIFDGDSSTLSNTAPKDINSNLLWRDAGVNLAAAIDATTDPFQLTLDANQTNFFRVGDIIQVGRGTSQDDLDEANHYREIMRVKSIDSTTQMTCERALYGTSAGDSDSTNWNQGHANTFPVFLPFFNAYHDTDKFSSSRTDNDGKFKASNFFGYGRAATTAATGILPGSIAIKCYNPGYQELGLSGITPSTNTGLTAGTTYDFTIAVDGGSAFETAFTVDSTNTKFGGRDGVLSKIQDVFDEAYYTSGILFEKKVTVSIVGGDVRFSSGSYLSTSAVALGTESGGDTDLWGQGRIPALATFTTSAVAAKLPDDTVIDTVTNEETSNTRFFMYDDGNGNLVGNGRGTINYDSGAIDFISKPNAEFVVTASFGSSLAGALNADYKNVISEVKVHSMNPKITGEVNLTIGG